MPAKRGRQRIIRGRLERSVAIARQHADRVVQVIGDPEIRLAVAVEVAHRHIARSPSGGKTPRRPECAVAIAQQDRHIVVAVVRNGEIDSSIPVEVARADSKRTTPGRIDRLGEEGSVAFAEHDACAPGAQRRQIGDPVSVKISCNDPVVCPTVVDRRLESTVAIPQQHTQVIGVAVTHHQIRFAVAVEVSDCHAKGIATHGVTDRGAKRPVAVPEKHTDIARGEIRHDHIRLIVAIEISHGDSFRKGSCRISNRRLEAARPDRGSADHLAQNGGAARRVRGPEREPGFQRARACRQQLCGQRRLAARYRAGAQHRGAVIERHVSRRARRDDGRGQSHALSELRGI